MDGFVEGKTNSDGEASVPSGRIAILTQVLPQTVAIDLADRLGAVSRSAGQLQNGAAGDIEILVTDPGVGASAALIAELSNLKLIACYGVGVDAIDLAAARHRGITVTNTPGSLADDVADLAMALLLASARDIVLQDRFIREDGWTRLAAGVPLSRGLKSKTIGILGLGAIGSAIAERAAAFRMDVRYHGPSPKAVPFAYEADLMHLVQLSDFLVVACRGGNDTRHLVNRSVLEALGPAGTLINISRGSVVDEEALVCALAQGKLGFAALDVFDREPHVSDALKTMQNVVLTPHQGSATGEARLAMAELLVANVDAFLSGRPCPTPVANSVQPGR